MLSSKPFCFSGSESARAPPEVSRIGELGVPFLHLGGQFLEIVPGLLTVNGNRLAVMGLRDTFTSEEALADIEPALQNIGVEAKLMKTSLDRYRSH